MVFNSNLLCALILKTVCETKTMCAMSIVFGIQYILHDIDNGAVSVL